MLLENQRNMSNLFSLGSGHNPVLESAEEEEEVVSPIH
jgi:hypothetical protein